MSESKPRQKIDKKFISNASSKFNLYFNFIFTFSSNMILSRYFSCFSFQWNEFSLHLCQSSIYWIILGNRNEYQNLNNHLFNSKCYNVSQKLSTELIKNAVTTFIALFIDIKLDEKKSDKCVLKTKFPL